MPQVINIDEWQQMENTRQGGMIDAIVKERGYGFIIGADGNKYFYHLTGLMDCQFTDLLSGDVVTFITRDTGHPGGPIADRIYTNQQNIINLKENN